MEKKYISSEEYRQRLVRDGDRRFAEWHSNFLEYQKKFLAEMSLHPLEEEVAAQKTEPSKKVKTLPRVAKEPSNRKENGPSPQRVESESSKRKENGPSPQRVESESSKRKENGPSPQRVESESSKRKENGPSPQRVESESSSRKENGQRQENGPKNE